MKMKQVKFSKTTKNEEESDTEVVSPETLARLYEEGAFLVVLDLPVGTEFGIDMNSWNTGSKFLGVKMVSPGLHFVYYSSVSSEGQLAPRTGFFHMFSSGEVLVRRWDPSTESLLEGENCDTSREALKQMDGGLAPYPFNSKEGGWTKWVSLSGRVTADSLARLQPTCGPEISSVTQMVGQTEEQGLPNMEARPEARINFTRISRQKYPDGASAQEITKHSLDSSYQLQCFLDQHEKVEEVLVEMQFSFLCFLVGQNYDSFEQWKLVVAMMCGCNTALLKYPQLFLQFMSDLHFQMAEVPDDFFVDIVSQNNFLVQSLTDLFENIKSNEEALGKLSERAISFENHLTKKFGWSFTEELDDDCAPVIVEI